jgi:6-pyruvoyltetrahydropterin/6-carboxytetrahydropterin synthase
MIEITRRFELDAGHRLMKHEGQCRNVHGHRYAFEVTLRGALDEVGRVWDFGTMKGAIGDTLLRWLDHSFIAQKGDPIIEWLAENEMRVTIVDFPPTAENLAAAVRTMVTMMIYDDDEKSEVMTCTRVRCYETPNCWADSISQ